MKILKTTLLITISFIILAGCNQQMTEDAKVYKENFEIIGEEKDNLTDISEYIYFTADRSNEKAYPNGRMPDPFAKLKQIGGTGRYNISVVGSGNVYVYDYKDQLLLQENLSGNPTGGQMLSLDVSPNLTFKMDGFYTFDIKPLETNIDKQELNTGIWEVGLDIREGKYKLSAETGIGYLLIFDPDGENKVYEVIGGDYGSTQPEVELKKGQKIKITEISLIKFDPID